MAASFMYLRSFWLCSSRRSSCGISPSLNYTYTTEQPFTVNVDGERFKVSCVVEGVGTNLFGYRVYMSKRLRIPLSELKFRSVKAEDGEKFLKIDSLSLHNAISVRLSDIKVISVGSFPKFRIPVSKKMIKVGITGGIGSGKSTVCRLLPLARPCL